MGLLSRTPFTPREPSAHLWPAEAAPGEAAERTRRLLARALEHELLPRLMHRHHLAPAMHRAPPVPSPSPTHVQELLALVRHADDERLQACLSGWCARGLTPRAVLLDLLAPVARQLGELWERDLCNFGEVTLGLGRLQRMLRTHCVDWLPRGLQPVGPARSILLAACPGEQHTFGLSLVAEFFHQAAWDVSTRFQTLAPAQSPARLAARQWFDVIGLSVGSEANLGRLERCIVEVRQASMNRGVFIIVGGPLLTLHPEFGRQLGVDAVITDGGSAPALAEKLLSAVALES